MEKKNNSKLKLTTLAMAQIAVSAALLCVLSPLAIPLPIPVPFTLQVLVVIMIALILKPSYAIIAQLIYTVLGIVGLPVFSGGKSKVPDASVTEELCSAFSGESFSDDISKERKSTQCNNIVKIAEKIEGDSAAGMLLRFRQNEEETLKRKIPNLANIRGVDTNAIAKNPSNDFVRFLIDLNNGVV